MRTWTGPNHPQGLAQLEEYEKGENSPEVLRCLSEWISILDECDTVPGTKLAGYCEGSKCSRSPWIVSVIVLSINLGTCFHRHFAFYPFILILLLSCFAIPC
ncbi:hypothetical protein C8R44DRAFT_791894 [Mycena epipterygia]|nr:hypothetical protein C8R44DRAFT_791894 [Mycena epipterygia]